MEKGMREPHEGSLSTHPCKIRDAIMSLFGFFLAFSLHCVHKTNITLTYLQRFYYNHEVFTEIKIKPLQRVLIKNTADPDRVFTPNIHFMKENK
jgi:hypothetical protein